MALWLALLLLSSGVRTDPAAPGNNGAGRSHTASARANFQTTVTTPFYVLNGSVGVGAGPSSPENLPTPTAPSPSANPTHGPPVPDPTTVAATPFTSTSTSTLTSSSTRTSTSTSPSISTPTSASTSSTASSSTAAAAPATEKTAETTRDPPSRRPPSQQQLRQRWPTTTSSPTSPSPPPPPRETEHPAGRTRPPPPRETEHPTGRTTPPPPRETEHPNGRTTPPPPRETEHPTGGTRPPPPRETEHPTGRTTPPPPRDDDVYSGYAEYPDSPENWTMGVENVEAGVIPDPDMALEQDADVEVVDERERASLAGDEFEKVLTPSDEQLGIPIIPDDSLADTDLREHDRMDGDGYWALNTASRDQGGAAGRQVVIVGAALSLVAQFLTLASAARRVRLHTTDCSTVILLNTELALAVDNLVFMLGVQSVGEHARCQWVAVAQHYLHLVAACWLLLNTYSVHTRLRSGRPLPPPHLRLAALLAWASPAFFVSAVFAANPHSYETQSFCWMSMRRGMLVSFHGPVCVLTTVNTVLTLRGLRSLAQSSDAGGGKGLAGPSPSPGPAELRRSLRVAALMLPLFAAVWFLGIVAMENSSTLTYPLLFLVADGFLNWFLLVCSWLVMPREEGFEGDWCGADMDDYEEDDELLLEDDEVACWGKARSLSPGGLCDEPALLWTTTPSIIGVPAAGQIQGSRWGEAAPPTGSAMADTELDSDMPSCSSKSPWTSSCSQELVELRFDSISTISS